MSNRTASTAGRRPPATRVILIALAASALLLGCGDHPAGDDTDVDEMVSIKRGVYGQLMTYCDIVGCSPDSPYLEGVMVGVFSGTATFEQVQSLQPTTWATSGPKGFFEVELSAGAYTLCPGDLAADSNFTAQMNCATATLTATQPLQRWQFMAGPGGGNWSSQ